MENLSNPPFSNLTHTASIFAPPTFLLVGPPPTTKNYHVPPSNFKIIPQTPPSCILPPLIINDWSLTSQHEPTQPIMAKLASFSHDSVVNIVAV